MPSIGGLLSRLQGDLKAAKDLDDDLFGVGLGVGAPSGGEALTRDDPVGEASDREVFDIVGDDVGALLDQRVGADGAVKEQGSTGADSDRQERGAAGLADDVEEVILEAVVKFDLVDLVLQREQLVFGEYGLEVV